MKTIQPRRIAAERFARFGLVARLGDEAPTAQGDQFRFWSDLAHYHVPGETEIGLCTVYRTPSAEVDWMERHDRTPEILIPVDAPMVLPVMAGDGSEDVEAFEIVVGEAVVIGTGVWHSACLPKEGDTATYWVIFRRGTPSEDVTKTSIAGVRIR